MNTSSTDKLKDILSIAEEDKLEFEKEILHFAFIEQVQYHMGEMKYTKLAEEMNVSKSFISQLFSGDKLINLEIMAKLQRVLHFKFKIDSKCNFTPEVKVVPMASYNLYTYLNPKNSNSFNTVGNG